MCQWDTVAHVLHSLASVPREFRHVVTSLQNAEVLQMNGTGPLFVESTSSKRLGAAIVSEYGASNRHANAFLKHHHPAIALCRPGRGNLGPLESSDGAAIVCTETEPGLQGVCFSHEKTQNFPQYDPSRHWRGPCCSTPWMA